MPQQEISQSFLDEFSQVNNDLSNIQRELWKKNAELEASRQQARELSRAKGEFLANMSHEIRTPMNGVVGMSRLMMETDLNERQREYMNIIIHSSESLLNIINDILDFSKIEAGGIILESTSINLLELVENTMSTFSLQAVDNEVELICDMDPNLPAFVSGDPVRLRQVIVNLVANAIKFTKNGEVHVKVRPATMEGSTRQGMLPLHVSVRDTGIGIPADKLDTLFKSFSQVDASTTRKFGGTGLGLAISKKLVDMMDGKIWVESKAGQGSTFHFNVLLGIDEGSPRIREHIETTLDLKGVEVLIVDGNKTSGQLLSKTLGDYGATVHSAIDAEEGLVFIKKGKVDLVFLDHQVPGIRKGEFIRKLREIRVVLMRAIESGSDQYDQFKLNGYLTKPLKQKELLSTIERVMNGRTSTENQKAEVKEAALVSDRDTRILVAEDNVVNQTVVRHTLARLGYQIELASDGEMAVKMAVETEYDIIFMDVQMPKMDGLEATSEIRKDPGLNQDTPIIAMTAYALESDRDRCIELGMNDYISKPIKKEEMEGMIQKWLSKVPVQVG